MPREATVPVGAREVVNNFYRGEINDARRDGRFLRGDDATETEMSLGADGGED